MKCECEACNGTGEVQCDECDGTGYLDASFREICLDKKHPHFDAIRALQRDAKAAEAAASRLMEMKPEHAASYTSQLSITLKKIESEASRLIEPQPILPHY